MRNLILWLWACFIFTPSTASTFTVSQITGLDFDSSHPEISISHVFKVGDLLIHPQNLTLKYHSGNSKFSIYGNATITIEGEEMKVHLGNESDPGIKVKSGGLEHFNIGITEGFELKGLTVKSKALTLEWTKSDHDFILYGKADVYLEKDTIEVHFGDKDKPGVDIKEGEFQSININITEDFELNDLSLKANGCGIN